MLSHKLLSNQAGKTIAAVLAIAAASITGVSLRTSVPTTPASAVTHAEPQPSRQVYRYSVIPGGVHSQAELKKALLEDPVAASHYNGFHVQSARLTMAAAPRKVYVSYRIGDRVFWTRKRVLVPKGEALLTDGINTVRTRCGNRISDTPMEAVSKEEPSEATLEASIHLMMPEVSNLSASPGLLAEKNKQFATTSPANDDFLAQFGPPQLTTPFGSPLPGGYGGASSGVGGGGGGGKAGSGGLSTSPTPAQPGQSEEGSRSEGSTGNPMEPSMSPLPSGGTGSSRGTQVTEISTSPLPGPLLPGMGSSPQSGSEIGATGSSAGASSASQQPALSTIVQESGGTVVMNSPATTPNKSGSFPNSPESPMWPVALPYPPGQISAPDVPAADTNRTVEAVQIPEPKTVFLTFTAGLAILFGLRLRHGFRDRASSRDRLLR